jgi:curli biogenesis system outer membrane secretion channel CsgG
MKRLIAMLVAAAFGMGTAFAQAPAAPPEAPVATPVHKKAAPSVRHTKVTVKKERTKKL